MKCSVFGRMYEVVRKEGGWRTYLMGQEGKKRFIPDIVIPSSVSEEKIPGYLEDIFHEQKAFMAAKQKNGHKERTK